VLPLLLLGVPITQQPVPVESLRYTYRGGSRPERWVGQGDCFSVAVAQPVSLSDFVYAFYTSPVFRIVGSAVAASRNRETGTLSMGRAFRWLMGFHVLYSRILLSVAKRGLMARKHAQG
jgi:hypothetical protein